MEWLTKYWKTLAAVIYLSICIFDFIGVPVILAMNRFDTYQMVIELQKAGIPERIMHDLSTIGKAQNWIPFTLRAGGLFHLSFGAILTGTIIGKRKKE